MNKNQNIIEKEVARNNKNYFFCYSKKLSDFLQSQGNMYITIAIDPKTKKIFSLYYIDDKLQRSLDDYDTLRLQQNNN